MKHIVILFFFMFFGIKIYCQNDCAKIRINYLDTVHYLAIFNKTALDTSLNRTTQRVVLFADSIFAIVEINDTNQINNKKKQNCIFECDIDYSSKQFFSLYKSDPIPIWEAYKINPEFTFFIIKNRSNWLVKSDYCYSASYQSKLFVQFDVEYADSLTFEYSSSSMDEIINNIEDKKLISKQKAESRLVIYQNHQRSDVLYFLDSTYERYSFPFGLAMYRDRYLIAGYNTVPKIGYNDKFLQYFYFIDIESGIVLNKVKVHNISRFCVINDCLYLELSGKEPHQYINCEIVFN